MCYLEDHLLKQRKKIMNFHVKIAFCICFWCLIFPDFLLSKPSKFRNHLNTTNCISPEKVHRKPVVMSEYHHVNLLYF